VCLKLWKPVFRRRKNPRRKNVNQRSSFKARRKEKKNRAAICRTVSACPLLSIERSVMQQLFCLKNAINYFLDFHEGLTILQTPFRENIQLLKSSVLWRIRDDLIILFLFLMREGCPLWPFFIRWISDPFFGPVRIRNIGYLLNVDPHSVLS
jgi:hypothetical protein